jgi:hypothetical protein
MNLGVHNDPVYPDIFQDFFCILKQFNADATFSVFLRYEVNILKSRFTGLVMQVWLHNKNYIPDQLAICSTSNAPQHTRIT